MATSIVVKFNTQKIPETRTDGNIYCRQVSRPDAEYRSAKAVARKRWNSRSFRWPCYAQVQRSNVIQGYNRLVDHVGIYDQRRLTEALCKGSLVRRKEYPTESSPQAK
ncbi:hypothetical protein Taro_042636 [Colocasia esculenta]|uniref:Uncharacterized protein n=1 Tax=Colocasia esculenta TaxID=4460 RepID=A0A843WHD9_COLES|nr:hypothetical protein [Colocasia esculenta]